MVETSPAANIILCVVRRSFHIACVDTSRFGPAVCVRYCQELRCLETSEGQLTSGENVRSQPRTIHRPAASKITPSTSFRLNLPRPQMTINWSYWRLPQVFDAPEASRMLAGPRFNPAPFIPTLKLPGNLHDPCSRTRARYTLYFTVAVKQCLTGGIMLLRSTSVLRRSGNRLRSFMYKRC